mgnify:CR=1 FL=1
MKHPWIIACIAILIVNFAGCTETERPVVNKAPRTNEIKVAADTPTAPTRTPLPPNVREDSDGNLIKRDGWPIQKIIPKETETSTETRKTRSGRNVTYNLLTITPENRLEAAVIPPHETPSLEWRITEVAELSERGGKIFCYSYRAIPYPRNSNANGMAEVTRYRLCDYDGDGKYEFNGSGFRNLNVPNWVK